MSDTWGADNSNNKKAAKTITTLTMATTTIIIKIITITVLIWTCVDMRGSMGLCISWAVHSRDEWFNGSLYRLAQGCS